MKRTGDPRSEDRAVALFQEGFSCSQSVLGAFAPGLGLDAPSAFRVSCAFGGGMAHCGETCGAVTGAFMALGLAFGRTVASDLAARDRTYRLARELRNRFTDLHGSMLCRDLLGVDLSTEEGSRMATEEGLPRQRCPALVRDAARIVRDLLDEEDRK
jgi:C_GCAxxG_C_C family probable redox protein